MRDESQNSVERDLRHLWHPCSQMKDYETFSPLEVVSAQGSFLHLRDGQKVLDAISSWWCKSLGHGHPRLRKALLNQAERFEHVILANTTNDTIIELSERLAGLNPALDRVFYAGDGSTAVEIAVKMALQAQALAGKSHRNHFLSLENGYHGESSLCLNLSDVGLYKQPYEALFTSNIHYLSGIPYVNSETDPLWFDAEKAWHACLPKLEELAPTLCAIVFEPLLQGSGGMRLYSADFLKRLALWAKSKGIFLIADEILTGLGRCGVPLACNKAGIHPDFVCLSKSLTSGWLPFSAVLTSSEVYAHFYGDYSEGKAFLHSNTFSGNALGAAVALETLKIYEEEQWFERVKELQLKMRHAMTELVSASGHLGPVRGIGAITACDLQLPSKVNSSQNSQHHRLGYRIYKEAVKRGLLLRPLGDTLYWLPPFNISDSELEMMQSISLSAIKAVMHEIS